MNWRGRTKDVWSRSFQCASFLVATSRLESFPTVAAQRTSEEQNVLRIRDYLNQHFTENITLDMTAKGWDIQLLMSHISLKQYRADTDPVCNTKTGGAGSDAADIDGFFGDTDCDHGGI